jgi:hypothetical protein
MKIIQGNEILPKKEGKRILIYPACGLDGHWIKFFDPDKFIGIDLIRLEKRHFDWYNRKTELILYRETDAITPPEIPEANEIVLVLKDFSFIGRPDNSELTQESWMKYQEENLTCLRNYLRACEERASKRVFVADLLGYESIIVSQGYRKLLSLTRSSDCHKVYVFCKSRPCEKAEPLFDWNEVKKGEPGFQCVIGEGTTILDGDSVYRECRTIIAYVKEK